MRFSAGVMLFLFLAAMGSAQAAGDWPSMARVQRSFPIEADGRGIEISLPLMSTEGKQEYLLSCTGGAWEYLDALPTKIYYVPDLMCLLNVGDIVVEWSLLAEEDVAPWHTRGQFHWDELMGRCGAYPEYGKRRNFRLRGFQLTLEAVDPVFVGNKLRNFTLVASVAPDPAARSSRAMRPGFLRPEPGCKRIRKGNEERMCRNWERDGIWERCPDEE